MPKGYRRSRGNEEKIWLAPPLRIPLLPAPAQEELRFPNHPGLGELISLPNCLPCVRAFQGRNLAGEGTEKGVWVLGQLLPTSEVGTGIIDQGKWNDLVPDAP